MHLPAESALDTMHTRTSRRRSDRSLRRLFGDALSLPFRKPGEILQRIVNALADRDDETILPRHQPPAFFNFGGEPSSVGKRASLKYDQQRGDAQRGDQRERLQRGELGAKRVFGSSGSVGIHAYHDTSRRCATQERGGI